MSTDSLKDPHGIARIGRLELVDRHRKRRRTARDSRPRSPIS